MADITGSGWVEGTAEDDVIIGLGLYYDPATGTGQSDSLYGRGGNDRLYGGQGINALRGDEGNDLLDNSGATEPASFDPNSGWSSDLDGGVGDDTLIGGNVSEKLNGGPGHDVIYGNGGNDFLLASSGADVVDLGSGNDRAWVYTYILTPYQGWSFDGGSIDGGAGIDEFFVIVPPINGVHPFADLLATRNADNSITVRFRPDDAGLTLRNFESIQANLVFSNSIFSNLENAINFNALTTVQQSQVLTNGALDLYDALQGNDVVTLPDAANWVLGPGYVWDSFKTFRGNAGDDTLMGGDSSDRIDGGIGNDNIAGNGGSDKLYGGDGVDELVASLNDNPGDSDYLDGGAGRDTFFVNAGDVVAAFNTDDDRIVFSTPYSVANIVVIYDSVLDDTIIRAFSDDRQVYQSILIEDGISPYSLAVRAYVGNYGSGTLIENIPLSQAIFGFGFDDQAAISGSSTELSNLIAKGIEKEIQKAMVDAGIDKVALGAFEAHVARTSAVAVAKNTSAFLAELNIYERRVEFVDSLAQIMLKFMKGQYDSNSTAFWGDFGEAMTDLCLPVAGGTIFRIGTELAVELITSALIKWGDAATASYLQLGTARTATPTTGDDVLWFDPDGSSYAFSDGNDIGFFGQSAVQFPELQDSEINQATGVLTNVDGGNGIDTLVYLGSENLVIDLVAGTTTHSTGTDHLSSIEKVATGSGNDTIVANAQTLALWGNGGNDRFVVSIFTPSLAIDGGDGIDTLVLTNSGSALPALSSIEGIELVGGASLNLTAAQFNAGFYNAISQIGTAAVSGSGALVFTIDANPGGAALSLTGLSFAGSSSVSVTITGSSGIDAIKGAVAVSNTITGGDDADQIRGGNQADTISGGTGNDKLFGWGGIDTLTGGAGSDQFRYFFATDSGTGTAADRITDFQIGIDRLNFTLIDADPVTGGDQAFAFVGTGAFTAAGTGQIRYHNLGADLLLQVDVDGNGTVDMEVVLQGLTGQTLAGADLML